jgi:hypothetical protein
VRHPSFQGSNPPNGVPPGLAALSLGRGTGQHRADDVDRVGAIERALDADRLDEGILGGLLRIAAIARCGERDPERDSLMHAYELLVGGRLAALGARDERLLAAWSAPTRPFYTRRGAEVPVASIR